MGLNDFFEEVKTVTIVTQSTALVFLSLMTAIGYTTYSEKNVF